MDESEVELEIELDGKQVESGDAANTFVSELSAGKHTVLIQLDARQLPEHVSIESDDVAFVAE